MLGKPTSPAIYQPWSLIQIVELIICLPLNLIPYVGFPAFILITGSRLGSFGLYRFYQLKGLSKKDIKHENKRFSWDNLWFGTIAMLLQLVPVLSFFFLLTSSTGAALWAVRLEEYGYQTPAEAAAAQVEYQHQVIGDPDEPPPPYVDNPV
jgi:hypothetical protein